MVPVGRRPDATAAAYHYGGDRNKNSICSVDTSVQITSTTCVGVRRIELEP